MPERTGRIDLSDEEPTPRADIVVDHSSRRRTTGRPGVQLNLADVERPSSDAEVRLRRHRVDRDD
ncbi:MULTISPECIES: hypothetical protein [unclassified Solwaraspora]|uniref:hypothetical protein n=1 Tax=unclassified Solwaraspora TaxID=2627926 RepID=UPI00259B7273|nr:hypothetical protein [Solwaraspora sp. WMMA2056]WJK42794.1 hypothetical protein O7608_10640 [Solwaraspora sp. WMMA2056]